MNIVSTTVRLMFTAQVWVEDGGMCVRMGGMQHVLEGDVVRSDVCSAYRSGGHTVFAARGYGHCYAIGIVLRVWMCGGEGDEPQCTYRLSNLAISLLPTNITRTYPDIQALLNARNTHNALKCTEYAQHI